jgi:hypothetical protein
MLPWRDGAGARLAILLHLPLIFTIAAGACSARESPPAPLRVVLHPAAGALPAHVSVDGLTSAELSAVRDVTRTENGWVSLLTVTIDATHGDRSAGALPPVAGRYEVTDSAIRFVPLFPFDPGRAYHVRFDPSRLPIAADAHRVDAISVTVRLPAVATTPTVVTAVHPSADVVPENILRVYIEFSGAMSRSAGPADDFVRLVELSGPDDKIERIEEGAFLPVDANFWSPDQTRYTVFFDPGRVKDEVLPNRESGRALRAGRRYAIEIAASALDASGQPLAAGYRHVFRAGPPVDEPLEPAKWRLASPAAGTANPLTVRFPRPLDHGILARALGVEASGGRRLDGTIRLEAHDTEWVFTPASPWTHGEYNLVAMSYLEDPQGNQIGRAFEELPDEQRNGAPADVSPTDTMIRLPFVVAAAR